jgi:hypothetical protein
VRALFAIPHYYSPEPVPGRHGSTADAAPFRAAALAACVRSLHQHYGRAQRVMQIVSGRTESANAPIAAEVHVVVCTTGGRHLLEAAALDPALYHHHPTPAEPEWLGLECRAVLRDRWGNYDWYGYLEDDLIVHDPWLFAKLRWFIDQAGRDRLLLPNRFERGNHPLVTKAYIDGDLAEQVVAPHQDVRETRELTGTALGVPVTFRRPLNPHSGCYFLDAEQMAAFARRPDFLAKDAAFVGPLESAATLGVMRTFKLYKPAPTNASFLEIEHAGSRFISLLRPAERRSEPSDRSAGEGRAEEGRVEEGS